MHGDSNFKFYHSVNRWIRFRNEVKGVLIGDQWCEEPEVVRREAKIMFEDRCVAFGVRLDYVQFKSFPVEDSLCLISNIAKEEVKDVVWMCEGSKSPGPNRVNFNFIKHN